MSDLNVSIRIRANADGSLSVINGVGNSVQNVGRQADQAQTAMDRLSSTIARVGHYAVGAFAVDWAAGKVSEIVMLADKMTLLDSRIKIAASSVGDYVTSSKELVAISLRTGISFEANVTIFSRVNKAMEQMGGGVRNTLALTETLSQSMRISGTSAEEAASTIRQLSQALASGVLRGDEFNSMMENAPRMAQALSDGMHVSIGSLRAMAEAGELTSKKVIEAIQSQSAVVNDEFAKIPLTVGAAMENIHTAFGQYVMEADKGKGATAGLAQQLNLLAHNLTPVIDGIITLGTVAATVFAGQMLVSLVAYIAAKRAAAAVEVAHSLAIAGNAAASTASIQATISRLEVQMGYIRAQQATVTTEKASLLATVASSEAVMNQARATLIATDAMIQSTAVIYIRRQALAAMAGAEVALAATTAELTAMQARQAILSGQVALSIGAQVAATNALGIANEAAATTGGILTAKLTLMSVAMGALNIAMGLFIGWQVGKWLNEFAITQNAATIAVNYFVKTLETAGYVQEKMILLAHGQIAAAHALKEEHTKSMAAHDELTEGIIGNNNASKEEIALSAEMKMALDSLKTPQMVYNQSISDATEYSKALVKAGKDQIEVEEQRLALGVKALEKWQQASAAEANAKLSDAGKEIVKLQDKYDKLMLSAEKYNQVHAIAVTGTATEKIEVERLSNAIDTLEQEKKAGTKTTQDSVSATKKAASEVENHNKKILELLQSLGAELNNNKLSGQEKIIQTELTKNLRDAVGDERVEIESITRQIIAETEARRIQQAMWDESIKQANELSKLKDDAGYAQELASMAKGLQLQGYSNAAIKEQIDLEKLKHAAIEANINLDAQQVAELTAAKLASEQQLQGLTSAGGNKPAMGGGVAQKETIETSRQALEAYNQSLDSAKAKTSDLGAVTSAIFDGALGGIHTMAGAFDNMVNSINQTTIALDENAKMQKLNESTVDPVAKASNSAKYAAEELKLNNQITQGKLSGARQIAGAVSSMLKQGSTEQRAAHAVEMGIAGWQMARTIITLLGIGAVSAAETAAVGPAVAASTVKGTAKAAEAVATQATAGPYIGFALMAAMAAAMAAIGFGVGGGSSSGVAMPTSPDTGTVLGDSTAKSQSIDKTYDLLKSIHAEEYKELRGINSGVAALSGSITNVITRLYQAGGLANVAAPGATTNFGAGIQGMVAGSSYQALKIANFGIGLDPISKFLFNGIFGGKQTSTVTGQGLSTGTVSLDSVMNGGNIPAQQYANIETKTKGGWFSSDKYKNSTQYQAIDSATQKSINDVFSSMGKTMFSLADNLGQGLSGRVKNYIIPAFTVELKGLSGEDAAKKLNGVISTALDTMSTAVFGGILGQYQQLGEGMLETAVRIVAEVAVVKDALAVSGLNLATNAIAISDAMIKAAGGIKEFQAFIQTYYEKFYSDTEKQARAQQQLNNALLAGLVVLPQAREGYRKLVEALDLTNTLDQQRYSLLLSLSAAADTYYSGLEAQMTTAKDNLATAYKNESDAMTVTINKFDAFSKSLTTFRDSLIAGNSATNLADKYNATRAVFNTTNAAISAGPGTTTESKAAFDAAIGSLQVTSQSFLSASKDYSANALSYAADYGQVLVALNSGISVADLAKSDATLQLDQMKASVSGLITINASVLSVRDAILAIQFIQTSRDNATAAATYAVAKASIPQFATGGEHYGGWRVVGENGPELERTGPGRIFSNGQSKSLVNNDELIAEIKQLKEEARSNAIAIAKAAADTAKILARWDGNGMPAVRVDV